MTGNEGGNKSWRWSWWWVANVKEKYERGMTTE